MRKHFLILMLMALLPFTAWAATPVSITEVEVTISPFSKTYNKAAADALPTVVTITGKIGDAATATDLSAGTHYDLVYKNPAGTVINSEAGVVDAGDYTVEIQAHAGYTLTPKTEGGLVKVFTVNKKALIVKAKAFGFTYGQYTAENKPAVTNFYDVESGWCSGDNEENSGYPVALPSINYDAAVTTTFSLTAKTMKNYAVSFSSTVANVSIAQKPLSINVKAKEAATYTGTAIENWEIEDYSAQLVPGDELNVSGLDYTYTYSADNTTYAAVDEVKNAGYYHIKATGITNDNYDITFNELSFQIAKKALSPSMINSISDLFYDGENHKPTVTVEDGTNPIALTTDYTVSYKKGSSAITDPDAEGAFKNADTYTVILTAVGTSVNYRDPAGAEAKAEITFKIKRKPVSLRTLGDNLTYSHQVFNTTGDGVYKLSNTAHLQWTGVLPEDLDETTNMLTVTQLNGASFALKLYNGTTSSATEVTPGSAVILDAGTYNVRAIISTEDLAKILNYEVTVGNVGKIKVAKKHVFITPQSVDYDFGTVDSKKFKTATEAVEADLWVGTTEKDAQGVITGVATGTGLATGDDFATVFATHKITLQRTGNDNAGEYTLTATLPTDGAEEPSTDIFDNYLFEVAENGKFTINAIGGVQVWANPAHSLYKGTQATLTAEILGVDENDITPAIQTAVNNSLKIVNGTGASVDVTTANAGTYVIDFDADALKTALEGLTNYKTASALKFTADYTVDKAAVKVKALPQTRMVTETANTVGSSETIGFELITDTSVDDRATAVPAGADATAIYNALKLAYNPTAEGLKKDGSATTDIDGEDKLVAYALGHGEAETGTATNGVYYQGITIVAADIATYNGALKNYRLVDGGKGQLTVTTADVQIFAANATDNASKLATMQGTKVNMQITGRNLYKDEWASLVLPFDVDPYEFCKKIETYAVFDVLKETGNTMSFGITIDKIDAYTPFLVKVNKNVDLSTITFEKVDIPAKGEGAMIAHNEAYNFVGTFDMTKPIPAWLITANSGNGSIDLFHNVEGATGEDAPKYTPAFSAYITAREGVFVAPMITIEELDGSTTAISAINADGVAVKAEGWYTINGVKLQGAPTEKGIYINNGKKIVVK